MIVLLILLFVLYNAAINVIISAALVPDFMRKLDQFEKATEQGYAQQVHTDQLTENTKQARLEAQELVDTVPMLKLQAESADGYRLIAAVFRQEEPSDKWVMLLHGYTGKACRLQGLCGEAVAALDPLPGQRIASGAGHAAFQEQSWEGAALCQLRRGAGAAGPSFMQGQRGANTLPLGEPAPSLGHLHGETGRSPKTLAPLEPGDAGALAG